MYATFTGLVPLLNKTRPSRPIRCDMWIVERMQYPTNQPTNQPTDTASYRGALSKQDSDAFYVLPIDQPTDTAHYRDTRTHLEKV